MIRVALFGAGRIGTVHARSVAEHDETELAWVCDPMSAAAKSIVDLHGGQASGDIDQALADDSVDAVVIASATPTHVDLLGRSVLAGKPVLCEKPIDLDLDRIDRCWSEIAGHHPWVMMGFNRRFDPTFRQIRRRVQDGEIGTIRSLQITSRDPEPPPAAYLAASGGIFRDMTIHDFDMARYFLGDITEVHAVTATDDNEALAAAGDAHQATVLLRGHHGALCTISNSRTCVFGYDQRLEAFGDAGMLQAANQTPASVRAYSATAAETTDTYLRFFVERYREAYHAEFAEFVRGIQENRPPTPGFADGRAALVLAEAAERSAATGRAVTVPDPGLPPTTTTSVHDVTNGARA